MDTDETEPADHLRPSLYLKPTEKFKGPPECGEIDVVVASLSA